MRVSWIVGIALAAAACGGEQSVPLDTAQSGTRLKLSWLELESGLRTWTDEIVDTQLGMRCWPTTWRDGKVRCTPSLDELPRIAFSDPACTEPMIVGLVEEIAISSVKCDREEPEHTYAATDERVEVPAAYRFGLPGCEAVILPIPPERVVGRRAVEQPPDLVTMERVYPGDGRLRIETLRGDDGSLFPRWTYDAELHGTCGFRSVSWANATSWPCVPEATETTRFADASCETLAAITFDPACPAPAYVAKENAGWCGPYFRVDETPVSDVFAEMQGACYGGPCGPDATCYVAAEPVETITIAREVEPGAGRLSLIYHGDGATRIRKIWGFYDTVLETECGLRPQDADSYVCVPVGTGGAETVFTDDACTQATYVTWIADWWTTDDPCVLRTPPKYSLGVDNEVRPIGEMETRPLWTTRSGGCRPDVFSNAKPYTVGAPLTAPLARVTRVID